MIDKDEQEVKFMMSNCSADGAEDELVKEMLDNESPFFLLPNEPINESIQTPPDQQQTIARLISAVYSGPTIQDFENALSISTTQREQSQQSTSIFERSFSKIENNKYTLKLKTCGNGMADDGYKWRKYGQKSIKNCPFPRSYYRCANPRCSAKKQVERSSEDEDTLIITYEGLHLHFAYPYFSVDQLHTVNTPLKKLKKTISEAEISQQKTPGEEEVQELCSSLSTSQSHDHDSIEAEEPQGLLEDVVPFMIRNPYPSNNINVPSNSFSSSSSSSSSLPTSPISSLSLSPNHSYSCFDIGLNIRIR